MRRIITISYTGLDAGGGVPKFNRDLHAAFPDRECIHYCWMDFPWHPEIDAKGETEWGRARTLNEYLIRTRKVTTDDVVIADGFWAAGLEHLPFAISHSHGIWSHLTKDDVDAGMMPDMPQHHAAQVAFRQRWHDLGKHMTAVSDFIAEQMWLQWGFHVDRVINNGVDTRLYAPMKQSSYRRAAGRPLIIHGANDFSNLNKGGDHIKLLTAELDADVMSLDQAYGMFSFFSDRPWQKHEILSQADLVVHPSGYEGNSMFVAEALASGVPFVGYNVGFAYWLWQVGANVGVIVPRKMRSPEMTLMSVGRVLGERDLAEQRGAESRRFAIDFLSIERFVAAWRDYVAEVENA